MRNPHLILGDENHEHYRDNSVQLFLECYSAETCLESSYEDWVCLLREIHDMGDLAVKRRDTCTRVANQCFDYADRVMWRQSAEKWHNLSLRCATLVEEFSASLSFLLPDIAKPIEVTWN